MLLFIVQKNYFLLLEYSILYLVHTVHSIACPSLKKKPLHPVPKSGKLCSTVLYFVLLLNSLLTLLPSFLLCSDRDREPKVAPSQPAF